MTEVEYISATHTAKESMWIFQIGQPPADPITLFYDNQSTIAFMVNIMKHISTRYHLIHEMVENCIISLIYCPIGGFRVLVFEPFSQHFRSIFTIIFEGLESPKNAITL